jgi:phage terminase small subunit
MNDTKPATPKPKKKYKTKKDKDKIPRDRLSEMQRAYVESYLLTGNKEKAALQAGYAPTVAKGRIYQLLDRGRVKEYYQARIAEIASKNNDKVALVIKQLLDIATADIRDFVDSNGQIKDISTVNGSIIQSIKHNQWGTQITLASKERALEMLGKYLGMYSDKIELSADKPLSLSVTFQEVVKQPKDLG